MPQYFNTGRHAVTQLVEARRHKPKGRGFDSKCVIGIFHRHIPQPLTEMSTRNISWGVKAAGANG